jgi:hypothetical protein
LDPLNRLVLKDQSVPMGLMVLMDRWGPMDLMDRSVQLNLMNQKDQKDPTTQKVLTVQTNPNRQYHHLGLLPP